MSPHAHLKPTALQVSRYTDGQYLPQIDQVRFLPGGGRGRPRKGQEARAFTLLSDLQAFLLSGEHRQYKRILVRFRDDPREYPAVVEYCHEKTFLTIDGVGVVTSVTATIEG